MGYPDIERARAGEIALRRIVDGHVRPVADRRALRRAVDLCREVDDAIEDDYCREKVRMVAEYAAELLSHGEHRARGTIAGAEFLRRQIRTALELVQSRLYSLERGRRYGLPAARANLAPASAFQR
jgi:hypothetical protein